MKKIMAVMVALMMSASLCGCGSGTVEQKPSDPAANQVEKTEAPDPLVVSEQGYSVDADGYMAYAAIIENPNSNWAADYPKITVTAKDETGAIVFSHDAGVSYIFAGGKQAVTGFTDVKDKSVASLEVTAYVPDSKWMEHEAQGAEADALFEVSNVNEVDEGYGRISYTGEVANRTDANASAIKIAVVLRDANGSIVAGYDGYANDIQPSGSAPFQIYAFGTAPEHASFEAYSYQAY